VTASGRADAPRYAPTKKIPSPETGNGTLTE